MLNRINQRLGTEICALLPRSRVISLVLLLVCAELATAQSVVSDPLPSWTNDATKKSILNSVERVTKPGSSDFVPVPERIATFDNDGTLWSEQPIYFQFAFALDRVKQLAPEHPEWKTTQPFKAVIDGDMKAVAASGEKGLAELIMATHTGMSTDEFTSAVTSWINSAQHPRFKRPYTDLVYQPMQLENDLSLPKDVGHMEDSRCSNQQK
jgi:hypothetical protein